MTWGGTADLDRKPVGIGSTVAPVEPRKTLMVFVTSEQNARSACHRLCEHESLRFCETHVAYNPTPENLERLIEHTKLVIIATSRSSVDKDSSAQKLERRAAETARRHGKKIAIFSQENHEAVQAHLDIARATQPLVIVPVSGRSFGEGFMDSFPMHTQFVERGESPAHIDQIVKELLNRSR